MQLVYRVGILIVLVFSSCITNETKKNGTQNYLRGELPVQEGMVFLTKIALVVTISTTLR